MLWRYTYEVWTVTHFLLDTAFIGHVKAEIRIVKKKFILFVFFTLFAIVSQAQMAIRVSELLDSTFVWNEKQSKEENVKKFMKPFYTGKKMQKGDFIITKLGDGNHIPVLFYEREGLNGPLYSRELVFFPDSFKEACDLVNDVAMYYHTALPQIGYKTKLPVELNGNSNMIFRNMTGGKTNIQFTAMKSHPIYNKPTFSILYMTNK